MKHFLIVVGILLGLLGIVESKTGISEDEIDKLLEIKMETLMKKYDRKIAILEKKTHSQANQIQSQEKKIHSQEEKIRILEEKCSSLTGAEEERENFVSFIQRWITAPTPPYKEILNKKPPTDILPRKE